MFITEINGGEYLYKKINHALWKLYLSKDGWGLLREHKSSTYAFEMRPSGVLSVWSYYALCEDTVDLRGNYFWIRLNTEG